MYAVSNRYKEVIYSQDCRHKLRVWFNNVEYADVDNICEKLTVKSRIIPFGSKVFMLENFISKEAELILHDINIEDIQDPVKISLGTLVDNEYEYVPIGIFNLQDRPTTDKGKTIISLRDNSVKFDFNYNAQPLIEEHGGIATKFQILQDICEKAGVTCNVTDFLGKDDEIAVYDNSKTGRMYISYIAGQGGAIPTINRNGELIFIYINNLTKVTIPLWYVEKYSNGDKFKISRVVYESGIIKYEKGTDNYDTLYLDANNPYISSADQVQSILNIVENFEINSFSTGKILGNPAIDSYDLISITDNGVEYVTFACNQLVYNGVCIQTFDSEIGLEARTENVSLNGEQNIKKWAKTQIDNVEAQVTITAGKVDTLDVTTNNALNDIRSNFDNYTPINRTVELEKSVTQVVADSYTRTQIDTMLRDGTVSMVKSTLVTVDADGTTWDKSDSNVKTNVDADGLEIIDKTGGVGNQETLLEAKYDSTLGETIVRAKRIKVEKYLTVGTHSRFEDYENGTGCFYLG